METQSSTSNFNGGFDLSFLSLLTPYESTIVQASNEFLDLPPLPPSFFDASQSRFLSPTDPDHQSNLIFPMSEYFTSTNAFPDEYEVKPTIPSGNLPELLSLENHLIPPEGKNSDHRRKKRRSSRAEVSDKIYTLEKLLPAGNRRLRRRLTTADVLEETHKYITFLKAQVAALRSMPMESRITEGGVGVPVGGLGRLSRQQVLEVVVNSPAAQAVMVERGCCVVSSEQIVLMKKIEARKELIRQLLNRLPPL